MDADMVNFYGSRKPVIDAKHLARQRDFSLRTFGPGFRTHGILDHIAKELDEIQEAPQDLGEWVDVVILALDGAWRAGHGPQDIIDAIIAKQAKNEARTWPDWWTVSEDEAIEHDRTVDQLEATLTKDLDARENARYLSDLASGRKSNPSESIQEKETTCPRCFSWFTESRNAVGDEQMLCGHKWHEVY